MNKKQEEVDNAMADFSALYENLEQITSLNKRRIEEMNILQNNQALLSAQEN
jgi:hypothetical protein